jgi:hypothetical protein
MILPTKVLKPVDSLYCISAFVVEIMQSQQEGIEFDSLFDELNDIYSTEVSIERLQYCLDFLFIIGKLEIENETLKVVLK